MPDKKYAVRSKSHLVVQANALVTQYTRDMTVNQLKLFYFLIGTVQKDDAVLYQIDVDYMTLYRVISVDYYHSGKKQYMDKLIADTVKSTLTPVGGSYSASGRSEALNWLKLIKTYCRSGKWFVRVEIEEWLRDFLLEQKQMFTAFQFGEVAKLKGLNALKLYPLFCSFRWKGSAVLSLEDLKVLLGKGQNSCSYKEFSRSVLLPAISEISEKTGLSVTVEPLKNQADRRRVSALFFTVKADDSTTKSPPTKVKVLVIQDRGVCVRRIRAA